MVREAKAAGGQTGRQQLQLQQCCGTLLAVHDRAALQPSAAQHPALPAHAQQPLTAPHKTGLLAAEQQSKHTGSGASNTLASVKLSYSVCPSGGVKPAARTDLWPGGGGGVQ